MAGDAKITIEHKVELERTSPTIHYAVFSYEIIDPTTEKVREKLRMIKDACSSVFPEVEP